MRRTLLPHPCIAVDPREQRRLSIAVRLALADLPDEQAVVDLMTCAVLCLDVLGDGHTAEAHEAVKSAAGALESAAAGEGSHAGAHPACEALVEVFEQLLRTVPLRRWQVAQEAMATLVPTTPE